MAFKAITCIVILIITVVQTYHHLDQAQLRIIPKMKISISLRAWHKRSTTTSWTTTISSTSHLLTAQLIRMISNRGKRKRRLQIWIIHICSAATNQQPLAPWIIYRCLNNSSIYPANITRPPHINRITSKRNTTGRIRRSNTNFKIVTHSTPLTAATHPSIIRCQLWTTNKGILCWHLRMRRRATTSSSRVTWERTTGTVYSCGPSLWTMREEGVCISMTRDLAWFRLIRIRRHRH
jgi:hypothetical protein